MGKGDAYVGGSWKLSLTGREATAFMKYHKGDPLAGGFLMILQVAKRIANVRFTCYNVRHQEDTNHALKRMVHKFINPLIR